MARKCTELKSGIGEMVASDHLVPLHHLARRLRREDKRQHGLAGGFGPEEIAREAETEGVRPLEALADERLRPVWANFAALVYFVSQYGAGPGTDIIPTGVDTAAVYLDRRIGRIVGSLFKTKTLTDFLGSLEAREERSSLRLNPVLGVVNPGWRDSMTRWVPATEDKVPGMTINPSGHQFLANEHDYRMNLIGDAHKPSDRMQLTIGDFDDDRGVHEAQFSGRLVRSDLCREGLEFSGGRITFSNSDAGFAIVSFTRVDSGLTHHLNYSARTGSHTFPERRLSSVICFGAMGGDNISVDSAVRVSADGTLVNVGPAMVVYQDFASARGSGTSNRETEIVCQLLDSAAATASRSRTRVRLPVLYPGLILFEPRAGKSRERILADRPVNAERIQDFYQALVQAVTLTDF